MKQMKKNVVIIGGGIIGGLLALILGTNGFKVAIIDRLQEDKIFSNSNNVKSYALNEGSCRLLNVLKIWEKIRINSQPISRILLKQGSKISSIQPFELSFEKILIKNDHIFYMIEEKYLKKALFEKIKICSNIEYLHSRYVKQKKITTSSAKVLLDNGLEINSDLIIGSDGYPSSSARQFKIKYLKYNYFQSSIVGILKHDLDHENEAVQIFLPSGPLAILPLSNNRSSFVWTMKNNEAERRLKLDDQMFLNEMNCAFQNRRGKIELEDKKYSFPISLALSQKIIKEKFVIIGDTAHKIHPIAGQGLNLGIRDVAALAEILILARRLGEDIGSKMVLKRYERWRNLDILSVVLFTDFANKIFSSENYILQFFRGFGFKFLNRSDFLKQYLIKEASGITGDVPKLTRGEKI